MSVTGKSCPKTGKWSKSMPARTTMEGRHSAWVVEGAERVLLARIRQQTLTTSRRCWQWKKEVKQNGNSREQQRWKVILGHRRREHICRLRRQRQQGKAARNKGPSWQTGIGPSVEGWEKGTRQRMRDSSPYCHTHHKHRNRFNMLHSVWALCESSPTLERTPF